MSETMKMIRCDECRVWFPMEKDHALSQPIFEYPWYWFKLFGRTFDRYAEHKEFCSWLCTKNFVDRMYGEHHPDDVT